jgi:hypothetical protein
MATMRGLNFAAYQCEDYLESPCATEGYYEAQSYQWIVLPRDRAEEIRDASDGTPLGFLRIGSPGVDGVSFGYRKGEQGIWSHDPILNEFRKLANDFPEFLQHWKAGHIQY